MKTNSSQRKPMKTNEPQWSSMVLGSARQHLASTWHAWRGPLGLPRQHITATQPSAVTKPWALQAWEMRKRAVAQTTAAAVLWRAARPTRELTEQRALQAKRYATECDWTSLQKPSRKCTDGGRTYHPLRDEVYLIHGHSYVEREWRPRMQ